jgi:hypothetical protein
MMAGKQGPSELQANSYGPHRGPAGTLQGPMGLHRDPPRGTQGHPSFQATGYRLHRAQLGSTVYRGPGRGYKGA